MMKRLFLLLLLLFLLNVDAIGTESYVLYVFVKNT